MIPARLLPHTLTWRSAGTRTTGYGQTVSDWTDPTDVTISGFMQPVSQREINDGRSAQIGDWLLLTNELGIDGADRLVWEAHTYEVVGPPARWDTPEGAHHAELLLRRVEG